MLAFVGAYFSVIVADAYVTVDGTTHEDGSQYSLVRSLYNHLYNHEQAIDINRQNKRQNAILDVFVQNLAARVARLVISFDAPEVQVQMA